MGEPADRPVSSRTPEQRQRASEAMLTRWRNRRDEMGAILQNLADFRAKNAGVPKPVAVRQAIAAARQGHQHTDETRAAMSRSQKTRARLRRIDRITAKLVLAGVDLALAETYAGEIVTLLELIGK